LGFSFRVQLYHVGALNMHDAWALKPAAFHHHHHHHLSNPSYANSDWPSRTSYVKSVREGEEGEGGDRYPTEHRCRKIVGRVRVNFSRITDMRVRSVKQFRGPLRPDARASKLRREYFAHRYSPVKISSSEICEVKGEYKTAPPVTM